MRIEITDFPEERAKRALGRLCGLSTSLQFKQSDRDMGEFTAASAGTADVGRTVPRWQQGEIEIDAAGSGETVTEATTTALGELFERYSLYWPLDRTVETTYTRLDAETAVVDAKRLQVWRDADLREAGYVPFDVQRQLRWTSGVNLMTGDSVFLPAEFVSFAPLAEYSGHFPTSTSGTACGDSLVEATLQALYEQIERDAVMRTWYGRKIPSRIDTADAPELAGMRQRLTTDHSRIELLDLPTPTDCSVVGSAWVNDRDCVPKFLMFAGAGPTRVEAARAALEETAEGLLHVNYRLAQGGRDALAAPDSANVYDFTSNVDYYMRPEQFESVRHLLTGDATTVSPPDWSFDHASDELDAVLAAIAADVDATPIAVDVTADDVRELGMYVVTVNVPELVSMTLPGVPPVHHPAMKPLATEVGHPFP